MYRYQVFGGITFQVKKTNCKYNIETHTQTRMHAHMHTHTCTHMPRMILVRAVTSGQQENGLELLVLIITGNISFI